MEERIFAGGRNLSITAYSVRQNPEGEEINTLVKVKNNTDQPREVPVEISDGQHQNRRLVEISPGEGKDIILSLPKSASSSFTASIDVEDDFPYDNLRYFNLGQSVQRKVRWVGEPNRYLQKALQTIWPVTWVPSENQEPVDLTVAYNTTLPKDVGENILLVHSGIDGLINIGAELEGLDLAVTDPEDPLLTDIDPFHIRVFSVPRVDLPSQGKSSVLIGGQSFIYRLEEKNRRLVLISSDINATNLPLTIDFPLLIRNILQWFTPLRAKTDYEWNLGGEPIRLHEYGNPETLKGPKGEEISIPPGNSYFSPSLPGIYQLTTSKGTYPIAVNVDPHESSLEELKSAQDTLETKTTRLQTLFPIWPYLAVGGLIALLIEFLLYRGEPVKWSP